MIKKYEHIVKEIMFVTLLLSWHMNNTLRRYTGVWNNPFGPKSDQIGTKWDKPGTIKYQHAELKNSKNYN